VAVQAQMANKDQQIAQLTIAGAAKDVVIATQVGDVAALTGQVGALTIAGQGLNGQVANLTALNNGLTGQVGNLTHQVGVLTGEAGVLAGQVTALNGQVGGLATQVANLTTAGNNKDQALHVRQVVIDQYQREIIDFLNRTEALTKGLQMAVNLYCRSGAGPRGGRENLYACLRPRLAHQNQPLGPVQVEALRAAFSHKTLTIEKCDQRCAQGGIPGDLHPTVDVYWAMMAARKEGNAPVLMAANAQMINGLITASLEAMGGSFGGPDMFQGWSHQGKFRFVMGVVATWAHEKTINVAQEDRIVFNGGL
jgi:hypothetical protein